MMTLEEVWENLRQDPETKATMEEAEKSYKLFKKIENLIVSDLEAKLAESEKRLVNCVDFNTWQKTAKENKELKQQLAESEEIHKLLETQLKDMERSKLAWENKYFKLEKQLAEERNKVVQEIREKLKAIDFLAIEIDGGYTLNCLSKNKVLDILLRIERGGNNGN